jgi:hypothetical protein
VNPGAVERAERAYEGFHWGEAPKKRRRVELARAPKALTEIGRLEAITYSTSKGGERAHWEHQFGEEGGRRPRLAFDPETQDLHIVGGDYRVEDRGIVD